MSGTRAPIHARWKATFIACQSPECREIFYGTKNSKKDLTEQEFCGTIKLRKKEVQNASSESLRSN